MEPTRFLGTVIRWSWLIILAALASAGAAYVISHNLPEQYEAESLVLIGQVAQTDLQEQMGNQQLALTYATLATTNLVLGPIADKMKTTVSDLASIVDARAMTGQSVVRVTATGASGKDAADLANAVGSELTQLAPPVSGQPPLVRVVTPAVIPTTPSSPVIAFNVAIAGALGLVLGTVLVVGLSNLRAKGGTSDLADPTDSELTRARLASIAQMSASPATGGYGTRVDAAIMPGGAIGWEEPDATSAGVSLPEGLPVRIIAEQTGMAQVQTPSGWTGWVDRRTVHPV